ncbi:hypothetical protein NEF87_004417 [Candidatus Lokiarchaeum ossiferum]|uniref:Uncharacterized protein n=1 Tax=Candidatus Lokiarchaeum ossiferum TaxID=2951803 RepID=A0ABY6HZ33_9ARCH|nr:hypothetical protein NEF87_004417 [Candidatus Lokiarchaeum sp. B-35]
MNSENEKDITLLNEIIGFLNYALDRIILIPRGLTKAISKSTELLNRFRERNELEKPNFVSFTFVKYIGCIDLTPKSFYPSENNLNKAKWLNIY